MPLFNTDNVIAEQVGSSTLRTYLVGYDFGKFRYDELSKTLVRAVVDFAFGFHQGDHSISYDIDLLRESANAIYSFDVFSDVKKVLEEENGEIDDDNKVLKRGEFGELILHVLLRDFLNTIPLVSKIHFKDSDGSTVHGFDSVHVQLDGSALWLGESKLYKDGERGVTELANDVVSHFQIDYLRREFTLISKKLGSFLSPTIIPERDEWVKKLTGKVKLQDVLSSVTIPLLCTYSSPTFASSGDETEAKFKTALATEISKLVSTFELHKRIPIQTNLNIMLMLFPVPDKNELVRNLHKRIYHMKSI